MCHTRSRNYLFRIVAVIGVLMVPAGASAFTWTEPIEVARVWINNDALLIAYWPPPVEGCTGGVIHVPKTHANYDEIRTLVLLAKATGKTISFFVNGCVEDSAGGGTHMLLATNGWVLVD